MNTTAMKIKPPHILISNVLSGWVFSPIPRCVAKLVTLCSKELQGLIKRFGGMFEYIGFTLHSDEALDPHMSCLGLGTTIFSFRKSVVSAVFLIAFLGTLGVIPASTFLDVFSSFFLAAKVCVVQTLVDLFDLSLRCNYM